MKIALGPVLYYWPRERLDAFYRDVEAMPVDIVYLGEVVCSRRHEYRLADWFDAAERLAAAGKEVVLSAQALMESESDLKTLRKLAENERFLVEANDMGAVHLLEGRPFVAGPHLNVYNAATLSLLASVGAVRWVPSVETTQASLAAILSGSPPAIATEVFAYGRMPLAFSARCFTARRHDTPKDACAFRCIDDPEGMTLSTRDDECFLVLNGVQTQSYRVMNLVGEMETMRAMGVGVVRVSPQSERMRDVIAAVDAVRSGALAPAAARAALAEFAPAPFCDGYWHGRPALEHVADAHA